MNMLSPEAPHPFFPHDPGWSRQEIDGHGVWLFEPADSSPTRPTILFLHDYDEVIPFSRSAWRDAFAMAQSRVIAPEGGTYWWLDQVIPRFDPRHSVQDFVVSRVLPAFGVPHEGPLSRLGILGIGMGGQAALAFAYRFPRRFPAVTAIAPMIDFHLLVPHEDEILTETFGSREWARQHTAILGIHPLNWPSAQFICCDPSDIWFDSADRLRMKLNSIGIPLTHDLETEAGGHTWEYFDHMAGRSLGFLLQGLRDASLRIVRPT